MQYPYSYQYQSCASTHLFMDKNHINHLKKENIPEQSQESTFLTSRTIFAFRNLSHRTWNMAMMKTTHLLPCKCAWSHSDQNTARFLVKATRRCQVKVTHLTLPWFIHSFWIQLSTRISWRLRIYWLYRKLKLQNLSPLTLWIALPCLCSASILKEKTPYISRLLPLWTWTW